MRTKIFFLCIFAFFAVKSFPTIWEIKQDGTGDFNTIQEGIDAAPGQDTVLVYPGTYYENLEINLQGQTLGSLYLTTGDESYISQTILDGNNESSVIYIYNNVYNGDAIITGFTIQHGIGAFPPYTTSMRVGGGIYSYRSNITVNNCIFQYNDVYGHGGGFCAEESEIFINDCIFQYNIVNECGGAIAINESVLNLLGSTIKFNSSARCAGGLIIGSSNVNFDNENLNNIYMNYAGIGSDIFVSSGCPFQEIVLDTFTVINPDDDYYFIYPGSGGGGIPSPGIFSVDIQHGYIEQVDQDMYVSSDGDNNNTGISPTDPLQTISHALVKIRSDSLNQRAIYIADGVYSLSENNQIFPMQVKSNVDIIGESMENTILDAEYTKGFFRGGSGQKNYTIENLSLIHHNWINDIYLSHNKNVQFKNLYMTDSQYAGSLKFHYSDVSFENITIENCHMVNLYYYGTEFSEEINMINCRFNNIVTDTPVKIIRSNDELDVLNIINTEITDNVGTLTEWLPTCSGLLVSGYLDVNIINSTIGNNYSISNGAGVSLENGVDVNIMNSIIYGNDPYNLFIDGREGSIDFYANNSLIEDGEDGQLNYGNNNVNWDDETMLEEDPLWLIFNNSYALSADSPCIDTGTLEFPPGVEIPAYDLAGNPRVMGNNIDMGAYEYSGNAAPVYLELDNETLSWQIPLDHSPTGYNIYLDDIFQATQTSLLSSYTYFGLVVGDTYKAGVSALYDEEETAIIPHHFIYQPVSSEDEIINPSSEIINLANYPNPFNPETTISFNLPEDSKLTLEIFNIKGQKIISLLDDQFPSGEHSIVWNGEEASGKKISSGVYLYKLNTESYIKVKKMLLIK